MTPRELQVGPRTGLARCLLVLRRSRAGSAASRTQLPIAIMANLGYRYYAHHLETHYTCDWPIGFREAA